MQKGQSPRLRQARRMARTTVEVARQWPRLAALALLDRIDFGSGLGDSANLLYGLVRAMKPAVCVEIGSARGRSACFIAMALRENGGGRLHAIDPHRPTAWNDSGAAETLAVMQRNLERLRLAPYVEIVRATSEEAAAGWTHLIDLLFIDGDHSYDGVRRDWDLFVPHVAEFGVVVFHDTIWDVRPDPRWHRPDMGVPRFVEELREAGFPVVTLARDCGVSLVQPVRGGAVLAPRGA
jgi:predicted O-methyltransferase YrrM